MVRDGARQFSDTAETGAQLLEMLQSYFLAQALHVAAVLSLAAHLADGPQSVDALAQTTGAHAPSLRRLLRTLASIGVFEETASGEFGITPLAAMLRSNTPGSLRDAAICCAAPEIWMAWSNLRHTVMTGEAAFEYTHGASMYDYVGQHPELGTPFHRWMAQQSELHNAAIVASYDFSPFSVLVDVAGGRGATLRAILAAYPQLRGVLFDLPHVVEQAELTGSPGIAGRCECVGGDMIQGVPRGADCYLIKRVLLGEPNERAVAVLQQCRDAMAEHGRVLVVDLIVPPGNQPDFSKVHDLLMLTLFGSSRARSEAEFRDLFAAAGLRLERIVSTPSPNYILEAVRA
jgi:hypothetical protein